jgi:hypothetical protein
MAARRTLSRKASILTSLSLGEKGELLDRLLTIEPQLRAQVEQLAHDRLAAEDRDSVAVRVEDALTGHGIEELSSRAGRQPGRGYVHESEAAGEILDEALQPFLDDMHRRAKLGMTTAAADLAVGVLCGLYEIRDSRSDTLLEYAPDYAINRADYVIQQCAKAGITLPVDDLLDLVPEWSMLLNRPTRQAPSRR